MKVTNSIYQIAIIITVIRFCNFSAQAQLELSSWAINSGADMAISELKSDNFKAHFDEAQYLYNDFSSYHYDPTVTRPMSPPVQLELNIGIGNETPDSFLGRIEYRFKLGVATHELGYDNFVHETFYSDYSAYDDAVFRNFYGFTLSCTNFYLGAEAVINSNYVGQNKRWRFGSGLGAQVGLTELMIYSYHLEGYYHVEQDLDDVIAGDYIYYFPAYSYTTTQAYETRNNYVNTSVYALGLMERSFFEKRKFHMGLQLSMGAGIIRKKSFPTFSDFYPSLIYTWRFLI